MLLLDAIDSGQQSIETMNFGMQFVKTVGAMVIVITLAVLVIKYLLPRMQMGKFRPSAKIKVLASFPLETRKILYVVRVGTKNFLLGSTDRQLTRLGELSDSDFSEGEMEKTK